MIFELCAAIAKFSSGAPGLGEHVPATHPALDNSPLIGQILFTNNGVQRMVTTKQYDLLNRLTNIVSSTNSVGVSSFAYRLNDANQRTGVTNVDGSYWVYTYDNLGQVTSGKKYWSDNSAVAGQQFTYTFDDIGNRTQTQSGGDNSGANLHTANYHANLLNQYTNRDVSGYVQMLGMAPTTDSILLWGNDPAIGGAATTFGAAVRKGQYFWGEQSWNNSSVPRWLSLSALGTSVSGGVTNIAGAGGNYFLPQTPEIFGYDPDGNLTNDGRWSFTWDGENRLVQMQALSSLPDGAKCKLSFAYDAKGRRIRKDVYGYYWYGYALTSRFNFVYDGWNLITELNYYNSVLRKYLWGLDLSGSAQGAGGVGGLLSIADTANGIHFVAYDGNGNVAALISATNSVVTGKYEYGPFGEVLRKTGLECGANPLRFSTKYQDDETDLVYYGYRFSNPSMGRWIGRDPFREAGFVSSLSRLSAHSNWAVSALLQSEWLISRNPKTQHLLERAGGLAKREGTHSPLNGGRRTQESADLSGVTAGDFDLYAFCENSPVDRIDKLGLFDYSLEEPCSNWPFCVGYCKIKWTTPNRFPAHPIRLSACIDAAEIILETACDICCKPLYKKACDRLEKCFQDNW